MKQAKLLISIFFIAILLNACGSAPTPASVQNPPVIPTTVQNTPQNTPQSTSTVEPATVVPTAVVPTAQEMTKVKMTIAQHTGYAPFYIADAEGFFKEYGIDVEFVNFNKSSEALALLVAGDIDVFSGSVNSGLFNVIGQEKNIKVVADRGHTQPGSCTYHALLVRKDLYDSGKITKAADLKGMTIAAPAAGTGTYLLSTYLAPAGLTLADVTLNDIPSTGFIDAFANKTIDGITTPEPNLTKVLKAGNAVLLAGDQDVLGNFQVTVVTFNKNLLVTNPDAGIRFLAAYLKGVKQYNEGKTDRNLEILAKASGETIDDLKDECWLQIQEDGLINFPSVDKFQQWSIQQGQLTNAVTEEQFWDPSVSAAALKLLNP